MEDPGNNFYDFVSDILTVQRSVHEGRLFSTVATTELYRYFAPEARMACSIFHT